MRKTTTKLRNRKFAKRIAKYAVIGQIIIILLFSVLFYQSKPIDIKDCTSIEIVVDEKEYVHGYGEYKCRIISNEMRYEFSNTGIFGNYTLKELYQMISKGECIDIVYVERYLFFQKYNLIIDARNESNVYIDIDTYTAQREATFLILMTFVSFVEMIFIASIVFGIVFHRKKII